MRRGALALVIGLAGCRCGSETHAPPPPAGDAGRVEPVATPIGEGDSIRAITCVIERAQSARDVLGTLVDELAPAPMIRRAADAAIARATLDGESPLAVVLVQVVEAYMESGDREGLRAALVALHGLRATLADTNSMLFTHLGPQRMRAGLPVADRAAEGDDLAITVERALAGDRPGATRFFDEVAGRTTGSVAERVAALVAIDRVADARAAIASARPEDRLRAAGAWLEVALRRPGPLDAALQAVQAELATAPTSAWLDERHLLQRAVRLGRARELAPLYAPLRERYAKTLPDVKVRTAALHELATLLGDTREANALAADPALAARLAEEARSLPDALAKARADKSDERRARSTPEGSAKVNDKFSARAYARLWLRASTTTAPPAFGAALVAAVCPPVPPRGPAAPPLAGAKIAAIEKPRGMLQECALHDVIVTLVDATGKELDRATLEGECSGACTAADKRAGRQQLAEIQARIDSGDASESETDYNFTECVFRGPDAGIVRDVGGRALVVIPQHGIGPHDVPTTTYQVALEVCGALYVIDGFGAMYAHSWRPEELAVRESADRSQIVIDGRSTFWRGVVARISLPAACPGEPTMEALDTE